MADAPPPAVPAPPAIADPSSPRTRVLWVSTWAFTALFAVWMMLGILGLEIKKDANLMVGAEAARTLAPSALKAAIDTRFEWLLALAILAGALPRLHFGIWADRWGGRTMMAALLIFCAIPTFLVGQATTFGQLVACALLFGLAGNAFTVGISWNSAWFPPERKGLALGVFGAGNVGAAGTKLLVGLVPAVLVLAPPAGFLGGWAPGGWRLIPTVYAAVLLLTAGLVLVVCPRPDRRPGAGRPMGELLVPLRSARVWRFSLYYVVVFGAYVALAGWLPSHFKATFGVSTRTAALLTALYIFPASLLRPLGGYLSDRFGPRPVTYAVFLTMIAALVPLSLPGGVMPLGLVGFTVLLVVVGAAMGIGKASVFKYVPHYYPNDVGAVGGLIGAIGALGGFLLPPSFGALARATGTPEAAFVALLALSSASLIWLHLAVLRLRAADRAWKAASPVEVTHLVGDAAA